MTRGSMNREDLFSSLTLMNSQAKKFFWQVIKLAMQLPPLRSDPEF